MWGKNATFASAYIGEVLEWLKRHAWKACNRQKRFGGSNPPLSAEYLLIMRKLIILFAMIGLLSVMQTVNAQNKNLPKAAITSDSVAAADSVAMADSLTVADSLAADALLAGDSEAEAEGGGFHKQLKTKFIDGNAGFMSLVALALVLGLAFCIERIIYLTLSEIKSYKLMEDIEKYLQKDDVEGAKTLCRNTRGPVASVCYQGLLHIHQPMDAIERSITNYGGLQSANLEKGCSWIKLFIAMAPSLGFLGTVIGMVMAFDQIQQAGDIGPTIVAQGMKVALITTIFGIVVALILQLFYSYILSKIERLTSQMEESAITLLDMITEYKLKTKK